MIFKLKHRLLWSHSFLALSALAISVPSYGQSVFDQSIHIDLHWTHPTPETDASDQYQHVTSESYSDQDPVRFNSFILQQKVGGDPFRFVKMSYAFDDIAQNAVVNQSIQGLKKHLGATHASLTLTPDTVVYSHRWSDGFAQGVKYHCDLALTFDRNEPVENAIAESKLLEAQLANENSEVYESAKSEAIKKLSSADAARIEAGYTSAFRLSKDEDHKEVNIYWKWKDLADVHGSFNPPPHTCSLEMRTIGSMPAPIGVLKLIKHVVDENALITKANEKYRSLLRKKFQELRPRPANK